MSAIKIRLIDLMVFSFCADLHVGIPEHRGYPDLTCFFIYHADHLYIGMRILFQISITGVHTENSNRPVTVIFLLHKK